MGWRENMGIKNSNPHTQNTQKQAGKSIFGYFENNGDRESKIKTDTTPPNLSKIHPAHRAEYNQLWNQAHKLADFIDGGDVTAPYENRIKRVPELNELVERMRVLEDQTKAKPSTRPGKDKKIPGIPEEYFQAPAVWTPSATDQGDHRDTCPACGQSRWWRKNEAGAKWICGRCHPPAPGLDAIFRDE